VNWRKLLAWLGALAVLAGLLFLLSGPPKAEKGSIPIVHQPPPPALPVGSSTNLYEWQSQEFSNRVLRRVETNATTRQEDREALDLQNLIIREVGPGR
jgi:hypothetical protein